jgi:hypothetical protein
MASFFGWLEGTAVAVAVAESSWIFPTLEVLHVLGLALVVGSIAAFDLRTLGLAWPNRRLETLVREVLPWTWGGFAIALATGGLLFTSSATFYLENGAFLAKMGLMLLAGCNVLFFHLHPHHRRLALDGHASLVLRISAAISLVLWTAIVVLGRWIGFV